MFARQQSQYCSLVQRYLVSQISALSRPNTAEGEANEHGLRASALSEVSDWAPEVTRKKSRFLARQSFLISLGIRQLYGSLSRDDRPEWVECLVTNSRLLHSVMVECNSAVRDARGLPRVSVDASTPIPRAYLAMRSYLAAVQRAFSQETLLVFVSAVQERVILDMDELWMLKSLLQLRLLQRLLQIGSRLGRMSSKPAPSDRNLSLNLSQELMTIITSLRELNNANWDLIFEKLSVTDEVLRKDPVYGQMEGQSQDLYRLAVAEMAVHSQRSEAEIAQAAVDLRSQQPQSRSTNHVRHVGYFLIDEGAEVLREAIGYTPSPWGWIQDQIVKHAACAYLIGIGFATFSVITGLLLALGTSLTMAAILTLLLVPAISASVDIVNHATALLFPPKILPKLDLSKGIPSECLTVVAIPTLLLNEAQTRQMADALEVRFLGNRDRNLHFALLTDSVDCASGPADNDPLVRLCSQLIERLNRKYAPQSRGSFFYFHRRQVYCASEGTWMGWERKRGKLLDFNSFLRGEDDAFAVKTGDLSRLKNVRYVITLDSDTQLPRDAARRLIGTLAHPLNRAVFDDSGSRLERGYAILQPKAGVAMESARKSRLAAIFSADATFDVYTRAVSNAYQDLFGEGNFVGKGIYDIDAFHRLLDTRLPEGTLLSHDMIEGSFARAGLVSDIEILEDYPSRYSAYCRRKHRWARGDWQTAPWIFPRVADRFSRELPNALQIISRWKIVDNLRRALYEPAMLLLLLAGWLFLPRGPVFWTGGALVLALLPSFLQLAAGLAKTDRYSLAYLKNVGLTFAMEQVRLALFFALLLHQSVLLIDAAARTLYRMLISRKKLLEWETAAQAEMDSGSRSVADKYLESMPWASFVMAGTICLARPRALGVALPFLMAWFLTGPIAKWLDGWWPGSENRIALRDREFLRESGLRSWRFFAEFSGVRNHWLISDRLQENPPILVERVSPTNVGLLLNSRLAAYDMGFIALPEVVRLTQATLSTVMKLPRFRGHFYNWYDTRTLQAEAPFFISSVDSGNLACSLLTTSQAFLQMVNHPLFAAQLWQGIRDRLRLLRQIGESNRIEAAVLAKITSLQDALAGLRDDAERWIPELGALEKQARSLENMVKPIGHAYPDLLYWSHDLSRQLRELSRLAGAFAPWLLRSNGNLAQKLDVRPHVEAGQLTIDSAIKVLEEFISAVHANRGGADPHAVDKSSVGVLVRKCSASLARAQSLRSTMEQIGELCENLAEEMDFAFLYNRRRKLLSIGYSKSAERLESACYDLLASEARMATFVAIAKGDIPQESWFYMGRGQTLWEGQRALISWAGSLFEYLMPNLWMRTHPNTLLDVSARVAVRFHQAMDALRGLPWGISEAAFSERDAHGLFQYAGFGAPGLALRRYSTEKRIISPYSSFLALGVETQAALKNIYRMKQRNWSGTYGFYESAEIEWKGNPQEKPDKITRCWMAHHQGMILLAISNLLSRSLMHRRFHAVPMIAATERLLHEKMPGEISIAEEFAVPQLDLNPGPAVELAPDSVIS